MKAPDIDENQERNVGDLDEPGRRLITVRIGACVKAAASTREWECTAQFCALFDSSASLTRDCLN